MHNQAESVGQIMLTKSLFHIVFHVVVIIGKAWRPHGNKVTCHETVSISAATEIQFGGNLILNS